jgi:hypothetical protein
MRYSIIRTGIVASAAAIALAACGGHGLVPSQSAAPGYSSVMPMSSNPCYSSTVQPAWIFMGSCVILPKLPTKGKTVALAAWKGVTVSVKLPKNTSTGGFVLVDALGGKAKDIMKFSGKSFPSITPTTLKSVVYVEAVNGTNGLTFTSGNLVFTIKAAKFSGTKCPLSVLTGTFPKLKWFNSPFVGSIKGGTMTFTVPGGALAQLFPSGLPAGPLYFNVGCK